eukprot:12773470-Alexandrium_andersonii.AAC.1
MSASLVGSEMCIRDSIRSDPSSGAQHGSDPISEIQRGTQPFSGARVGCCLLYTSDAADDM